MKSETHRALGRWLGVASRVGQALCYWVLTGSGQVLARTTIQAVSIDELHTQSIIDEIKEYDTRVNTRLGEPVGLHQEHAPNYYLQDCDNGIF